MAWTVVSTRVAMMSLHATVMFFPCVLVRKETRVSLPGLIVTTVGMLPLIVAIPAGYLAVLLLMSILVTIAIIVCKFWWITTLICMSVTGDRALRQHKASSSNCSQQ